MARAQSAAPLTLDAVLRAAATRHPLVEAARARVTAAHGTRRTAGAFGNPALTVWTEGANFPGRAATAGLEQETQLYATLPLEPLFQRQSRVRGANEDVAAASADLARARQLVALDAARAFYRVAAAQTAVAAGEDVRARLVNLETYNRERVKEGITAEADLIRTQVELDRVDATTTLDRVELARAWSELTPYVDDQAILPGISSGGSDTLRVRVDDAAVSPGALPTLDDLIARARATRPDVVAARARAAAARAGVGYEQSLTIRHLGATVGTKRAGGLTSMIAGLSLPLPLFDQNRGEVQRASGERAAAEQELAWAERRAAAEVGAAHEAARLLAAQAARFRGTFVGRAEEARRIAVAAYEEGAVTLLQVLDASRTLGEARVMYARTLYAERTSRLELGAAIGDDLLDGRPFGTPSSTQGSRP